MYVRLFIYTKNWFKSKKTQAVQYTKSAATAAPTLTSNKHYITNTRIQ